MKTNLIVALVVIVVIVTIAIVIQMSTVGTTPTKPNPTGDTSGDTVSATGWRDTDLKDVRTGESFKISEFEGKVILESFAVWCPICKQQQDEIKLMRANGDSVIHISLDTDPNEDESRVLEHVNTHGYDWFYAVAPIEMTQSLIEEFGLSVVNAPGAPVILVCEDSARFLDAGVKNAAKLAEEVAKGC